MPHEIMYIYTQNDREKHRQELGKGKYYGSVDVMKMPFMNKKEEDFYVSTYRIGLVNWSW